MAKDKAAHEKLTFEEALTELEKVVRQLEAGAAGLEASIEAYAQGVALKKLCESRLKEAQSRIEKITIVEGKAVTEPFVPGSEQKG